MARRTAAKRRAPSLTETFSDSVQTFLARRLVDGAGLVLAALGVGLLAALATYDSADPSLNTAATLAPDGTPQPVHNLMGLSGAWIADVLLQTLGLGGVVLGLVPAIWGWRLLTRRDFGAVALRLVSTILGSLLLAAAFARVPSYGLVVHAYLGGSGGTLVLNRISEIVQILLPSGATTVAALAAGLAGLASLLHACAVSASEIRRAFALALSFIVTAAARIVEMATAFFAWVQARAGFGSAEEEEAEDPRTLRARRLAPLRSAEEEEDAADDDEDGAQEEAPAAAKASLRAGGVPASLASALRGAPKVVKPAAKPVTDRQGKFPLSDAGEWILPSVDLLQEVPHEERESQHNEILLQKNAEFLQNVLGDFNVRGEIVSIHPGPVVTLYELEPAPGTKTSRVISLSDDIARSMSAVSVRSAVVPGRNVIGIELPNKRRQTVYMRELVSSREYDKTGAKLPLVLGKDIGGQPVIADLARMPHLLVAGTTGSGKSVAVNAMLLSLLYRLPPEKCRLILIDPKMLELSVYDEIPHLLSPVVTEPGKAVVALKWAVREMEDRYRAMSKLGVRNIEGYNVRLKDARKKGEILMRKVQTGFDPETGKPIYEEQPLDLTELPYIVVVVDEFADLMLVAGKDVENAVQRLAQMARAAGIHLIMATQRPSVDVITGVIKANFPTRISFQVTSKIDSRTILGESGAEQLLGMGDMLYMAPGGKITRVHGPFVSDRDVEGVVNHLKAQGEPAYIEDITDGSYGGDSDVMAALFGEGEEGEGSGVDALYDQAVSIVARERKASTSFIQRHLMIGYNRAARIIEEMERQGVVTPANAVGKREVLVGDHGG